MKLIVEHKLRISNNMISNTKLKGRESPKICLRKIYVHEKHWTHTILRPQSYKKITSGKIAIELCKVCTKLRGGL